MARLEERTRLAFEKNGEILASESLSIAFIVGSEYSDGKSKVSLFRISLNLACASLSGGDHDGHIQHTFERVRCVRLL